jgi:ADP-ribose pyrophosphatase
MCSEKIGKSMGKDIKTIVIGDGLTNAFLSAEHPFHTSRSNVGKQEIERLMGRGRNAGKGPLPMFLRQALEVGPAVKVVLFGQNGEMDSDSEGMPRAGEFVESLEDIVGRAQVITAADGTIPWKALIETFTSVANVGSLPDVSLNQSLRFIIVGCHTERRILAIASFLRSVLGFIDVAVSSHLVGSTTPEGHFATLRHNLPRTGIRVFLSLEETAEYAGLDPVPFRGLSFQPCTIEPPETRDALESDQGRIIELLCMHWTRANVRPLAGGFSGSLLLLAEGWRSNAKTEPMVLKVDAFSQMRRELDGYHQVKEFFGKHVPTFGYPVAEGNLIGVGMELAAMEGSPKTLQDSFEMADDDEAVGVFMRRLEKALALLSEKLYKNTRERAWVVPYRVFGVHAEEQQTWLRQNGELIVSYLESHIPDNARVDCNQLAKLLRLISSNPDVIDSEVCLSHGDLNYANIICDEGDNIWFIDWTHTGQAPLELDFAKLEADTKFVMSKQFDVDDLSRLKQFEEYLLSHRVPADINSLPENLKFAKWDLRYRRVLDAVRGIREACFALKENDDWIVYQVALLRYAMHTLSFDKRRDRGECDPPQLMYALYSVESLIYNLVMDDFHLKIRAERPSVYPPRQRISIDEAPWVLDCDNYAPPYYINPMVIENDWTKKKNGWAEPEDFLLVKDDETRGKTKFHDDEGRPLNPNGRTGIAGRGQLGRWGVNHSVAAVVMRSREDSGFVEILLGAQEGQLNLSLFKGFVLPDEDPLVAVQRVLKVESGWQPAVTSELVFDGYTYDPRQTDHAWVETLAYFYLVSVSSSTGALDSRGEFDEVKWWPLDAETINRVPSGQSRFIREAVVKMREIGQMEESVAAGLLSATG